MLEDVLKKWDGYEVSAMEVYTDIFSLGEGMIQKKDEPAGEYKANPLGYWKNDGQKTGHFRIMFDDTFEETLKEMQKADFALLNGITYFGRKRDQNHASKMYAMIFDLDHVNDTTLNNFLSGAIVGDAYPVPNYIVLSGNNVHLYYVFENPIPLFPNIKLQLKEFKYSLTERIWNKYTSEAEKKQKQGIFQPFRVIGGKTKEGAMEHTVRAFRINAHPFNLDILGNYLSDSKFRVDENKLFKESKLTLADAKEKYPKWYDKVVVNKDRTPKKWDIQGKVHGDNPYALYDWWFNKVKEGAAYNHRYFCVMCLVIYGVKVGVPFEKVKKDAYSLIPFLNSIYPEAPFTEHDVESALECYDDRYCTFPTSDIASISAISIVPNKRNNRNQAIHLKIARSTLAIMNEDKGKALQGRPDKAKIVEEWRESHPDGKKADCIRDTGLSKKTVYKWWDYDEVVEVLKGIEKDFLYFKNPLQNATFGDTLTDEQVMLLSLFTNQSQEEVVKQYSQIIKGGRKNA